MTNWLLVTRLGRLIPAVAGGCLISLVGATLHAAEIKGKVAEANDKTVRIATASELLPNVGDVVEIYFEIPGFDEPVPVASGQVTEVTNEFVVAAISGSKTKVTKNHLA